jgi:23S rRNA (uracil1939-C5)-methyltransferase
MTARTSPPEKMTSHCQHFGICGGCAVDDPHAIDKFSLLRTALERAGFVDAPMAPLVEVPAGTRRRADLAATRKGTDIALGLHKARGTDVVDMHECVLLRPEFLLLLPPLRELLRSLTAFRRAGSVVINWLTGSITGRIFCSASMPSFSSPTVSASSNLQKPMARRASPSPRAMRCLSRW